MEDKEKRILLIDGLNMFIRVFASVPALNDNGDHVGGVLGFLKSLALVNRIYRPDQCYVVFDGSGGSMKRRKIFSGYKNNRRPKPHFNRFKEFEDKESEQKSMNLQIQRLVDYLSILPISVISMDHMEADDVIAYLATKAIPVDSYDEMIICSMDKDYVQLCNVNPKVTVYSPIKKIEYKKENIFEHFGVIPDNFLLYRTFLGDPSDAIPGIKGVGAKTLIKSVPELNEKKLDFSSLKEILENRSKEKGAKKFYSSVLGDFDILERNYQLMQLEESIISGNSKMKIIDMVNNYPRDLDIISFARLINQDRLSSNINYPVWLRESFNCLVYGK